MKEKLDRDAAEFCPDALAIRHADLPWWARFTVVWMGAFFLFMLLWAGLGKVEVIVSARGRIISIPPTIVMKPLERTVIKEICVRTGDRVEAGQLLVLFDPVFSKADSERLGAELQSCKAQFCRLSAEFEGRGYELSKHPSEDELWQYSIFRQRRELYQEKMNYFDGELERLKKRRAACRQNLDLQQARLATYREIEGMHKKGTTAKVVSLLNLRQVEISRLQLEADISDKENEILVLDSEMQARTAERDAFRKEWSVNVAEEMVKAREMLTEARKEYEKAVQRTAYVELRAPEDAMVHDIAPLASGSAVREAETLITLVPLGGELEVEAEIRAEDRGKVHEGDDVRVKVSAFPFQKYGTLSGTVRTISEDTFQQEADKAGQGGVFYRARIALGEKEDCQGRRMGRLVPGMETVSEISIGKRRILEYLTDPIIKSLDEAVREP